MNKKLKLLHVHAPGETPTGNPLKEQFPDAQIDRVDVFGLLAIEPAYYDLVYCGFALQVVPAGEIPKTIDQLVAVLADRGELWVVTPALEWVAHQILSDRPSPVVHAFLFGERDKPTRCGFTLAWLRALLEEAGLIPRKAQQGAYIMAIGANEIQVPCNIAVGWKVLQ